MKKLFQICALTFTAATFSTGALAFGLGDVKKKESTSSAVDIDSVVKQQAVIVHNLVNGLKEYTTGQAKVAHALGLKDDAEKLEAEAKALASGNVKDKKAIKKIIKSSESHQKNIDKKLAKGGDLSAESKNKLASALPSYAKGTANTVKLLPEVKDWGTSATGAIKEAGWKDAPKLKKEFDTGLFIVSELPGYMKKATGSYSTLLKFFKKNKIDTSKAEELLGDDF